MKRQVALIALLMACSGSLLAHWPKYQDKAAPRDDHGGDGRFLLKENRSPGGTATPSDSGKAKLSLWQQTIFAARNPARTTDGVDVRGSPYTDQTRFVARFRRPIFGKLQIDVTVNDPASYTKPFTVRINQRLLADEETIEFVCNENQQFGQRIQVN